MNGITKAFNKKCGEARSCSYIYRVNEARRQAFKFKNKGYEKNKRRKV